MINVLGYCYVVKMGKPFRSSCLMLLPYCLKYTFILLVWIIIFLPSHTIADVNSVLFQDWKPPSVSNDGQGSAKYESDYIQLPKVDNYHELKSHKSFSRMRSQFLRDIKRLKELAGRFIGKVYNSKIDDFYNKMDNPPKDIIKELLVLYKYTRLHIHQMVEQLENEQKINLGEIDPKGYIALVLHLCLNDIDLCPAAVHTRFTHSFLDIEASQAGLSGQLFKVRMALFRKCIASFMVDQQRHGRLDIPSCMEVHWCNGLYNLGCGDLKLPYIKDRFAERYQRDSMVKDFLFAVPLFVSSCTILRKLAAEWSDYLGAILKEKGVMAWETGVISSPELLSDIAATMDGKIFLLVNDWLKTTKENELNFSKIMDGTDERNYSIGRYREKVFAWVTNYFHESSANVFAGISSTAESNLYIGSIGNIFFWVFYSEERLDVGQACTFDTDNHITLELSHLTSIDLSSNPDATYALLTQALEQTNRPEDIASFFLNSNISNQLSKVHPMVIKEFPNQLTDKLARNGIHFKTRLLECICNNLTCSHGKIVSLDLLGWLIDTPLLEPVLLELKQREIDISLITNGLLSWHILDFSKVSIKQLLTYEDCQRLFKQACTLMQAKSACLLLLTGNCDELINFLGGLGDKKESLLSLFARTGLPYGMQYLLRISIDDVNYKDAGGNTPLIMAAGKGHVDCVSILLSIKSIGVKKKRNKIFVPTRSAVSLNNKECSDIINSENVVQVNTKNAGGWTALHFAVASSDIVIINMLLAVDGIQVNCSSNYGFTPLLCASKRGDLECIAALLTSNSIKVNKENSFSNETPLIVAIRNEHQDCAKYLINDCRIKLNKISREWGTPLAQARRKGLTDIVELIEDQQNFSICIDLLMRMFRF